MRLELRDAIVNFRRDQERALSYLHSRLGIPVPKTNVEWAVSALGQIQTVASQVTADGVHLRKHGYGIEVIHPEFRVDYDYGPAGECDCFDAWRLGLHKHILLELSGPVECNRAIGDWIAEAKLEGDLIQVANASHLFVWPKSRSTWSDGG